MNELEAITGLATVLTQSGTLLRKLRQSTLSDQHRGMVDEALDVVSDVIARLLSIQTAQIALQQENTALKAQISEIEDWKGRFAQYRLAKSTEGGILLIAEEPFQHYACVRCAEDQRKIYPLQYNGKFSGATVVPAAGSHST